MKSQPTSGRTLFPRARPKPWPDEPSRSPSVHPEVFGWAVVRRRLLPRPVGRGEGWGEGMPCRADGPPLPVPLLPPREEREKPPTTSGCTGSPSGLGAAVAFLLLVGVGFGCSPPVSRSSALLQSRLFERVEVIGLRGTGFGQLNKPRSLALDTNDNFYVVDMTGRVQKFSPRGQVLASWRLPETDLGKPKGMCRDRSGNIVVMEPHYQRVNHFSPEGTLLEQWGTRGQAAGQLTLPRAVAVNSRGNIFLSEYTTVDRVQGFSADGRKPLVCFGRPGTGPGEFNRAEGLGIGPDDRIYVADSCNHRIQIFSSDGLWLKTYGSAGSGLGQLSYPYDVCVDAEGRQYVCEFGNSRIQIFDAGNRPLEILGGVGGEPGKLNNPWSIALDSHGNLYVADSGNHRVQKFIRRSSAEALRAPAAKKAAS